MSILYLAKVVREEPFVVRANMAADEQDKLPEAEVIGQMTWADPHRFTQPNANSPDKARSYSLGMTPLLASSVVLFTCCLLVRTFRTDYARK